jgi:hypothetical protein
MDKKSNKKLDDLPLSTPSRIIIQSREQSYTFDKGTYRDDYLRHCISKKDYDEVLDAASKIMGQSWSKKRLNDTIKLPRFVIVLALTAVILTVVYMILLYLSTSSENGTALLIVSIVCVSIGSLIAFGLSIYNFCRQIGKFKSLEEIIKEDLDAYLEITNRKYDGLLFYEFNSAKRWIECNIVKMNERGDREEKKYFIPEEVEEDVENENEVEEEVGRLSKKHSRMQSHMTQPKKHSKTPSIITHKIMSNHHSRSQSIAFKKAEDREIELGSFSNKNKDKDL